MPISLILTPFDHFHFRPALAVKCIHDLRICHNDDVPKEVHINPIVCVKWNFLVKWSEPCFLNTPEEELIK